MKRSIGFQQIAGFLFTSFLGTFLHFFYDLMGESLIAALISAVNESIWEHMKLLFYPMVLFALLQRRLWKPQKPGLLCAQLAGILLGLTLIPTLYYTYTGILGQSYDWFNVTIFFIAAGAAYWLGFRLLRRERPCPLSDRASLGILLLICLVFTLFTFLPPRLPLFQDPLTGSYGR